MTVPNTVSKFTNISMPPPDKIWDVGSPTFPIPEKILGIDHLVDQLANTTGIILSQSTGLPGGEKCLKRTTANTSRTFVDDPGLLDVDITDSIAVGILVRFDTTLGTNVFSGKRGSQGFDFRLVDGMPQILGRPATGGDSYTTISESHKIGEWHYLIYIVDRDTAGTELAKIFSELGSATTSLSNKGSFSSALSFGMHTSNVGNTEIASLCAWTGAKVSLLDDTMPGRFLEECGISSKPPTSFQQMYVNVRDFGAKGDGVADDTASIAEAISVAGTSREVIFPAGIYITDEQNITARSIRGVHHFRNDDGGTILKRRLPGIGAVLKSANNACRIQNLAIDANGAEYGIDIYKGHGGICLIQNVGISDATVAGFYLVKSNGFAIRDCVAQRNTVGFHLEAANGGVIDRSTAESNTGHGIRIVKGGFSGACMVRDCVSQVNGGRGISIEGQAATNGNYIDQIKVYGQWVEGNVGHAIHAEYGHSIAIRDSRIIPGPAGHNSRGLNLKDCVLVELSGNRVAYGVELDFLKIRIEGGHSNILENNWRLSHLATTLLEVENV